MAILYLKNEKTGSRWRIWPAQESIPPGAVQEAQTYLFILEDSQDAATAELTVDDARLEALRASRSDVAAWRWSPGFHAGVVEAELSVEGRHRFSIVTDAALSKLSREDFDLMVREILEDTFALFALSGFRKGIAKGQGQRPPPIARLEFIRSRILRIEQTVRQIIRSPRWWLSGRDESLPYHRVTRVTGPDVLRSMRSGRLLRETKTPAMLPTSLRGFLPATLRVRRSRNSLDLIEHRQILSCLLSWADWLRAIEALLESRTQSSDIDHEGRTSAAIWSRRCRKLVRTLSELSTNEFFDEIGIASPTLNLSQIFRNDPKYRQFYRLWQDMNLGIASVFGDFLAMPLSRTFELYELWCFLRLLRAATDEFGVGASPIDGLFKIDGSGGLTLAAGSLTVSLGDGWVIFFQRQFKEYWLTKDGHGSFSRWMTPDIVLTQTDCSTTAVRDVIVLDAKYRIDTDLNDSLSSIHTYRDALVTETDTGALAGIVRAAYLLTPYIPALGKTSEGTSMPSRLFHPLYRSKFRFGAATIKPGMTSSELRMTLRNVVADAGM